MYRERQPYECPCCGNYMEMMDAKNVPVVSVASRGTMAKVTMKMRCKDCGITLEQTLQDDLVVPCPFCEENMDEVFEFVEGSTKVGRWICRCGANVTKEVEHANLGR